VEVPGAADDRDAMARRLRLALDLCATGEALLRQRIRREAPHLGDAEVEARLAAWFRERPGAEHGDAAGRPVAWPRDAA
jgi:hypothetical protein